MSTLALDPSPSQAQWQPPRPGGMGIGALLALIAHALLVGALAVGVAWRTKPSEVVMSAELWSAVPEVAAPAPVAPPPHPKPRVVEPPRPDPNVERQQQQQRDAQIALEKAEKKKKLEMEQQEKLKEEKLKEERLKEEKLKEEKRKKDLAAKQKAEEERLAKQREENLARIRGLAGASGPATSTGQSLRDAAPSASYAGRILARIKPNIVLTGDVPDSAETTVEVKCAPDGRITGRRIVRSTGHALYEEAVLRAIDKAEVLPKDVDGRVPATMTLVFKRKE
ncbi:energy transducer TonB [Aquabacterium sp.]|uniref:energy transducer TonB n=1 Tax=Aquabacterium sp. TaxID=1872578 RepID=UPI0037846CF9